MTEEKKELRTVEIKNLVEPLEIKIWPNPILRQKCAKIEEVTDWHRELAGRMAAKMKQPGIIDYGNYEIQIAAGVGLSAPQVGHAVSMLVLHREDNQAVALLNPEIVWKSKKKVAMVEGCLSFPQLDGVVRTSIKRPAKVVVKCMNLDGYYFEVEADGDQARVLQHEMDHLNGVLMIDKLPLTQRNSKLKRYLAKLKKLYQGYLEHQKAL